MSDCPFCFIYNKKREDQRDDQLRYGHSRVSNRHNKVSLCQKQELIPPGSGVHRLLPPVLLLSNRNLLRLDVANSPYFLLHRWQHPGFVYLCKRHFTIFIFFKVFIVIIIGTKIFIIIGTKVIIVIIITGVRVFILIIIIFSFSHYISTNEIQIPFTNE